MGQGQIRRIVPYRGGYRVFLDGWRYPYFIPFHRFRLHRLRVGLFIRFGAFFDPLGFYSVYEVGWPPYGYAYPSAYYRPTDYGPTSYDSDGSTYTTGELHGVVESVDFRRGTLVIHDDTSGEFVTVRMPRDRRLDDVRVGDHVDFSGGWTSRGVFEAYRLERFEPRQ